jgi:hypothetical protein
MGGSCGGKALKKRRIEQGGIATDGIVDGSWGKNSVA